MIVLQPLCVLQIAIEDAWYGWPEFFAGEPITNDRFQTPGQPQPTFLWKEHPPLTQPYLLFESHEAANGIDFSPGGSFGFEGDMFVAMYGTFAPLTAQFNLNPVGFRVARVDLETKQIHEFASNELPGPEYLNQGGGFDRPSDIVFAPDQSMYIVDWGAATLDTEGLKLVPKSGVVWRIYSQNQSVARPQGPVVVTASEMALEERQPMVRNTNELYVSLLPTVLWAIGGLVLFIAIIFLLFKILKKR